MLQVVAEPDPATSADEVGAVAGALDAIALAYARRFAQTEVLVVTTPACVGHVRPVVLAAPASRR